MHGAWRPPLSWPTTAHQHQVWSHIPSRHCSHLPISFSLITTSVQASASGPFWHQHPVCPPPCPDLFLFIFHQQPGRLGQEQIRPCHALVNSLQGLPVTLAPSPDTAWTCFLDQPVHCHAHTDSPSLLHPATPPPNCSPSLGCSALDSGMTSKSLLTGIATSWEPPSSALWSSPPHFTVGSQVSLHLWAEGFLAPIPGASKASETQGAWCL